MLKKIASGVKKAFKPVTKTVMKVAPYALAGAAIYFTAGAALGVAGAAGGWGAAAGTIGSKLGTGMLAKAVTGAITQAGYGAAIGGAMSAATGGSVTKGMQAGAVTGAVTGGLMGGAGMRTDPLAGAGGGAPGLDEHAAGVLREEMAGTAAGGAAGGGGAPSAGGAGGLFSQGGWLERNQKLAGGLITGVGAGLTAAGQASADKKRILQIDRMETQRHEGMDPMAGYSQLERTPGQSPTERFSSASYGSFEFQYDPAQARIVRVPRGA